MKKIITAVLAVLALCIPVYGQDVDYSGSFVSQAGVGLPYTHDNKGDFLIAQTYLTQLSGHIWTRPCCM